ncbi:MAG TPA: UDPGP type 1 family protein [Pirellulales bacterium]|jgi:UDP-N-acetylglucosamine/UDP-N-acetylgalactosamine diphosphorylase|nr:UDPGP type 1 family protein [Pirellulales bacterium]
MVDQFFQKSSVHEELSRELAARRQEHLLRSWKQLSSEQQQHLASQIRNIDFAALSRLFETMESRTDWDELSRRAEPPEAIRLGNQLSAVDAQTAGEGALRNGKVGAILVAGGQGTRLGFDHPKGMYPIGPISNASLFQILLEKLLAIRRRFGAPVPLYVMTSNATHQETKEYLNANHWFGLPSDEVYLFCQGVMPAVDAATGRVLLSDKGNLALSPDGHGGMLAALDRTGSLADIQRRGLTQLFYFQVDNPLVEICDPKFLGFHIFTGSEMSTLAILKRDPTERVGNIVRIDGHTRIIEYSDLPEDVACQRNSNGTLRFWAGNTAIHVFDVAFLRRAAADDSSLPFHVALKKVPYFDDMENHIEPTVPNAIKFERFIFDLLPLARKAIVVETDPASSFAPVKNRPGEERDSPDTCRNLMTALHRKWLAAAGVKIGVDVPVEISPLFALDAVELRAKIKPGIEILEPTYFY